ncbi:conserved protein of unknown function [Citrobacter amalonaticus]|uniref:Uncharacterized protein n=1 Tax=Citrobacter amalonaticus TaxID=35703 RepID=A0AAX2BL71_CITAM|nr:conserved protein of unknown function [Citrobacter amalonaticus]SAZ86993.1 conserved protein of unknown function [Citrobacter amalonaticus]
MIDVIQVTRQLIFYNDRYIKTKALIFHTTKQKNFFSRMRWSLCGFIFIMVAH